MNDLYSIFFDAGYTVNIQRCREMHKPRTFKHCQHHRDHSRFTRLDSKPLTKIRSLYFKVLFAQISSLHIRFQITSIYRTSLLTSAVLNSAIISAIRIRERSHALCPDPRSEDSEMIQMKSRRKMRALMIAILSSFLDGRSHCSYRVCAGYIM